MSALMTRFRASDGAELAYLEQGSGDVRLLFVHGWQADHTVWDDVISALRPGVQSVAVDLRGSGSSNGARGPHNLERFAADLRELVDALGTAPVVIVAHSMGATVALRLALDAPETVSGLILVAPVPASGAGFSPKGADYLRATAGDPVAARKWLSAMFAGERDATVLDRVCGAAAKTPRDAALEGFESWANADFAEATRTISAPAVVIAPERDNPDVYQRKVAALLPNARFVLLPDSGHYAILERPAEIAAIIADMEERMMDPL
jgi:pimeloyl-ACP methyl ester carboxylesterase